MQENRSKEMNRGFLYSFLLTYSLTKDFRDRELEDGKKREDDDDDDDDEASVRVGWMFGGGFLYLVGVLVLHDCE